MSTHNLCFRAKVRKNTYPCKPQFYYMKVGCKGYTLDAHVILMENKGAKASLFFAGKISHRTTDCFDDRLLLRRQIRVDFAGKG